MDLQRTILPGAVALGLGLIFVGFGVAYLTISNYHPWPELPSPFFWGHPELGILFVAGGMLAYGEGIWLIRSRLDRHSAPVHDLPADGGESPVAFPEEHPASVPGIELGLERVENLAVPSRARSERSISNPGHARPEARRGGRSITAGTGDEVGVDAGHAGDDGTPARVPRLPRR